MPMRAMRDDPSLPSIEAAQASREHAIELHDWCLHAAASSPDNDEVQHDLQEMSVAAQFTALLCDKIMLLSNMHDARKTGEWLQRLDDAATQYADCWSKRYKPSGLNDIRHALSAVGHDLRTQHDPPR